MQGPIDRTIIEYLDRLMDIALGKRRGTIAEERLADKLRAVARFTLERELFNEQFLEEKISRELEAQKARSESSRLRRSFFYVFWPVVTLLSLLLRVLSFK
jgi:hypothetical protein